MDDLGFWITFAIALAILIAGTTYEVAWSRANLPKTESKPPEQKD